MEEYVPGRTENLHDYLIPTIGDVPQIETILIEDREPLGPYGAKGIGEPALIPTAPAILGAIHHATGRPHHPRARDAGPRAGGDLNAAQPRAAGCIRADAIIIRAGARELLDPCALPLRFN